MSSLAFIRRRDKMVLVAENSMAHRRMLGFWLQSYGVRVLTAFDGQQAWEIIQREPVDLLISAEDMPRMNGLELANVVRMSTHRLLPIVLLVATARTSGKTGDSSRPVDAVLQKGTLDMTKLLDTVSGLLHRASNRQCFP
jgi:CheY-like chemotaxis protein